MRILFVAFGSSIHTARWISQLKDLKWDIHLFPVDDDYLHHDFRDLTLHTLFRRQAKEIDGSVRQKSLWWPFRRGKQRILKAVKQLPGEPMSKPSRLARLIGSLKPDIVHSLEMQHAGYLTLDSQKRFANRSFPPWIYTCWGSDIYYFGKQPEHEARIRSTLASCDYLTADCQRDIALAKEFGFAGEVLGVFPGAGGYDIRYMQKFRQSGEVSSRKVILLKGRHEDFGGRALVALQALQQCAKELSGYEVVIVIANGIVPQAAEYLSYATGIRFSILPNHSPHEEVLRLMGRARIAINIACSEGTPNFLLEAMAMGAFPIQSDTGSTAEWIENGENGFLVSADNPESIAEAIRQAIADDALVNSAAEINLQVTLDKIDRSVIQPQVIAMYKKVAAQGKR